MNIKQYLIFLLLGFCSLACAMEQETKKEKIYIQEETIRILPNDAEEAIEVPLRLAKLSRTINCLINAVGIEDPIPVEISSTLWRTIHYPVDELRRFASPLEMLYGIQNGTQKQAYLIDDIQRLPVETGFEVLKAVNYLDIPLLFSLMINNINLTYTTGKQLKNLPADLCRALLLRFAVSNLGPFHAPLTGWQATNDRGPLVAAGNNYFVTGGAANSPVIWDPAQGKPIAFCNGHADVVLSMSVVGDKLATGSQDGTIRVWKLPAGDQIAHYVPQEVEDDGYYAAPWPGTK